MRRTGAGVVFLVLVLPPPTAFADERAGDDIYDASVYRDPCLEHDGVVGRRKCPAYGAWAVDWPAVTVTFGLSLRHLPRPGPAISTKARTVTGTGIDGGSEDTSYVLSEQIAVAPNRHTYFAFEVEFAPSADEHMEPGERVFGAATHLVFGVRGGTKAIQFGAEIAGGIRLFDGTIESQEDEAVLETRLRGELSLTPWLFAGALIGTSLIDRGDWVAGIAIGARSNAFGGL